MTQRDKRSLRKYAEVLNGLLNGKPRRRRGFEGEKQIGSVGQAELLVGLDYSEMQNQVGKVVKKNGSKCRVGWYIKDVSKSKKLRDDDVIRATVLIRVKQFRNAQDGERIDPRTIGMSSIKIKGAYGGKTEDSVRLVVIDDGADASPEAFKKNMKLLAQELACALAQQVVITSIGKTSDDAYMHSPTAFPAP